MGQLSALLVSLPVVDAAPGEHRRRRRHGESELDMVACVEPAAGEIDSYIRPVARGGITFPRNAAEGRFRAGDLDLVKPDRLLQCLTVVERGTCLEAAITTGGRSSARAPDRYDNGRQQSDQDDRAQSP